MQIDIVSRSSQAGIDHRKTVGERVRVLLERFQSRIRRIELHLVDDDAPGGGADRRCLALARLDDGMHVVAEAQGSLVSVAVDRALRRIVRRIIGLQRRRRSLRRVREALQARLA